MRDLPPIENPKSLLPGNLLVAAPAGGNERMSRAVILILEHSTEGAEGVVLNSEANEAMKSWCREMSQQPDKQAVFEHLQEVASSAAHLAEEGSSSLPLTVCMAKPAASVEDMVDELGRGVRIFVGRIVWAAGELEKQALAGNWMITPASPELVFGDHENLWKTCIHRIGESVLRTAAGIESLPEDVLLN